MGQKLFLKSSLLELEEKIRKRNYGILDSTLLYLDGVSIFEGYYNGYTPDILHEFQSVTKSLQSVLVGIAIDNGFIKDVETPISTYFEDEEGVDWGNGKAEITIRDLLQMTAGLDWNEGYTSYMSLHNHSNQLAWSKDWVNYALSRPMESLPGEKFIYSSANPILISSIFNKVYEEGHEAFAMKYLLEPLGINHYRYHSCELKKNVLADIDLLPRDMAKFAKMIEKNGIWQGKRIVSSSWVHTMLTSRIDTGKINQKYSYSWWHSNFNSLNKKYSFFYAWGYGSQHICIVPTLNLILICTGKNYDTTFHSGPFMLLEEIIEIVSNYKKLYEEN